MPLFLSELPQKTGTPWQPRVSLLIPSLSLAGGRVIGLKESLSSWSSKSWSSRVRTLGGEEGECEMGRRENVRWGGGRM